MAGQETRSLSNNELVRGAYSYYHADQSGSGGSLVDINGEFGISSARFLSAKIKEAAQALGLTPMEVRAKLKLGEVVTWTNTTS